MSTIIVNTQEINESATTPIFGVFRRGFTGSNSPNECLLWRSL